MEAWAIIMIILGTVMLLLAAMLVLKIAAVTDDGRTPTASHVEEHSSQATKSKKRGLDELKLRK